MKDNLVANLWNVNEANKLVGTLAERVYSSRLLGANTNLVLHGGGNTCLLYTSPSPRDRTRSRMPSSA